MSLLNVSCEVFVYLLWAEHVKEPIVTVLKTRTAFGENCNKTPFSFALILGSWTGLFHVRWECPSLLRS